MLPPLERSEYDSSQLVLPWSEQPHTASWAEVEQAFGTSSHRRSLLYVARGRIEALEAAGFPIMTVWLNGSFVTGRDHPNDIDAVIVLDGMKFKQVEGLFGRRDLLKRYEPSATASSHKTDFQYLDYYPEGTAHYALVEDELEHWSKQWSRLKLISPDSQMQGTLVKGQPAFAEDAKGYVEVRWAS